MPSLGKRAISVKNNKDKTGPVQEPPVEKDGPGCQEKELEATKSQLQDALNCLHEMQCHMDVLGQERDAWKTKTTEIHDQYLRAKNDLDAFRKRTERDFDDRLTRSMAGFAGRLLEVMDNYDRTIEALEKTQETQNNSAFESFLKGVVMIRQQMVEVLEKEGVKPIPSPVGQVMDPALHEAVLAQEGGGQHGLVLEVLQKGYVFKNLVLRATKVKVVR